jgi:PAS domain S-box-containing protein
MTYKRILIFFLLCAVAQSPCHLFAADLDQVRLQLRGAHQFQFAGYYAAIEKDYYRDAGLNVSLREKLPGKNCVEQVLADQADFGVVGAHMIRARLNGKPLIALAAIFQHSPYVLFALEKSQIKTPTDLVGRRAMQYTSGGDVISAMLHQEAIDQNQIEWATTSHNPQDLIDEKIDLYPGDLTNTAFFLSQHHAPYTVINPKNYGVDFYGDLLYTTETQLQQHPERVKAFLDASLRGWTYALKHPQEMIDLIQQRYAPALTREQLAFEADALSKLIRPDSTPIGHISSAQLTQISSIMRDLGQAEDVWQWSLWGAAALLLAVLVFYFWARSLKKEVRRRQQAEAELIISVDRYQQLIQALPHGILEVDQDFSIIYCSPPLAELLGYQATALVGCKLFDFLNGSEYRDQLLQLFDDLKRIRKHQALRLHLLTQEKESLPVQFDCDFIETDMLSGQVIVVTNLKAQEQTERRLFTLERAVQKTLEHVQVGVAYFNKSGRITWVNPYLCKLLGYTEQELCRLTNLEITHQDDRQQSRKSIDEMTCGQQENVTYPKRFMRKDGKPVWTMISTACLREFKDQFFVSVIQGIDELKSQQQVEEKSEDFEKLVEQRTGELQNRVDEVEQLNLAMLNLTEDLQLSYRQLQGKSEEIKEINQELEAFAYSVSHDLRAPLRHVQGFAAILQSAAKKELSAKNLVYLDTILASAERMGQLIDELLAFSRAGRSELKYRPVDTDKVLKETIQQIKQENPERKISWNVSALPVVDGDLGSLRQVFTNLLNNAVKYSTPREEAVISVTCETRADEVVYCVADNGVGFDPKYKHKLFAVFSRLHRADQFEGTGIGLANVKQIVKKHGGKVWAESKGGSGAQFYFSIPCGERGENGWTVQNHGS